MTLQHQPAPAPALQPVRRQRKRRLPACADHYAVVPTRLGVRLVQHGTVLSEVRSSPGPTHSVADVLAAILQAIQVGPRVLMLGFAGGGTLAPLRAMGGCQTVDSVDLDDSGWRLFRLLCSAWAGEVKFWKDEAGNWLRASRRRYDAVIEDLSVVRHSDVCKPEGTWSVLPPLIHGRLGAKGVAVFNLLRPSGQSWARGLGCVGRAGWCARVVAFDDFENRILIVARSLPAAPRLSRLVRGHLQAIGSRMASRISVRHWTPVSL